MKDLFTILAPSIVGWLGYLWVLLIKDIKNDSYDSPLAKMVKYSDSDDVGTYGAFLVVFGPLVAIIACGWHIFTQPIVSIPTLLSFVLGGAHIFSIAGIWSYRKFKLANMVRTWFPRLTERFRDRDSTLLKQANKRVRKLCAVVPQDCWADLRASLQSVVADTLPPLLKRREELRHAVRRIGELIAESDKTTLTDFSQSHLQKVIVHKRTAETELEKVQREIGSCLDSLELLEADLLIANVSGDAAPITRQLAEMQQQIEATISGSKEIDRYMDKHPDLAER